MRKSIFDIVAEKLDMEGDTYRLATMAVEESTLVIGGQGKFSLFKFVDEYCFTEWAYRSRYLNVDDFLGALDFPELVECAKTDIDAHLTLIELIYNFWNLAFKMFDNNDLKGKLKWCGNFFHMKDVMDEILEEYNHVICSNNAHDRFLVIENKPEVTAAAELMPTVTLAFDVIKYNHRSLKGDVSGKKTILLALGNELEPKRKTLQNINKQLSENIFFMLNSVNLRHNNCSIADPRKYKKYVAGMTQQQLEDWYDELYQMMLLAFLLLDNEVRSAKVEQLKTDVVGGV